MTDRDIPHGHGGSFKKGFADGLLGQNTYESEFHETHRKSYKRGFEEGEMFREVVAKRVRPEKS